MSPFVRFFDHIRTQGMGRAFRHRDYTLFALTSWLSTIGMWMQRIGVGWLTWELTQSGTWLGLVAAAGALPAVFLIPFTGAVADRVNRLKLMRVTQVLMFVLNSGLAALTLTGLITVELLFAISLSTGIVMTFNMPARMTLAPSLVPREDLGAAIAVGSFVFTSSTFIGPALGGLIIEQWGVGLCFVANAASYLPFYAILYVITLRDRENRPSGETSLLADVVDGVRYIARHPGIGPVLILSLLTSLLIQPITDLVPGFVDHVFNAGAAALGLIMSAFGLGGMAGALWMANRSKLTGTARIYFLAGTASALATLAFASITALTPAIALMALMGFTGSVRGNAAQTLIQGSVEPSHRARVISLYSLTHRAGPALGAMVMGAASDFAGLQVPVAVGAVIALALFVWLWRRRGAIADATEVLARDDEPAAERPGVQTNKRAAE